MKRIGIAFSALTALSLLSAHEALSWRFETINGSGAGKIKACAATHEFRNAWITVRVYGEEIDFVYHHDDFAFPWDQMLGPVLIKVDGVPFLGAAGSVGRSPQETRSKASTMMIAPKSQDYAALFTSLKNGREMLIIFPNGDVYPVSLKGSGKALQIVSECWQMKETGPNDRNPFEIPEANNPFQTPLQQPVSNPFEQPA